MPARTKVGAAGAAGISSSLLGGGGGGGFVRCRTCLKSYACFSMQSLGNAGTSEGYACLEVLAYANPFFLLGPCPDHPS